MGTDWCGILLQPFDVTPGCCTPRSMPPSTAAQAQLSLSPPLPRGGTGWGTPRGRVRDEGQCQKPQQDVMQGNICLLPSSSGRCSRGNSLYLSEPNSGHDLVLQPPALSSSEPGNPRDLHKALPGHLTCPWKDLVNSRQDKHSQMCSPWRGRLECGPAGRDWGSECVCTAAEACRSCSRASCAPGRSHQPDHCSLK